MTSTSLPLAPLVAVFYGPFFGYTLVCLAIYSWRTRKAPPRLPQVLLLLTLAVLGVAAYLPLGLHSPLLLGLAGVLSFLAGNKSFASLHRLKAPPPSVIGW